MELNYTPLSDGFKIAKDDNGNIVFARNDTTLFVASPDDLHASLTPLIGAIGASAPAAGDAVSAGLLAAADANVESLTSQLAAAESRIASLEAQISADKAAAEAITKAVAQAQAPADAAPSSTEPGVAPTIAPSNTGITGS